MSTIRQKKAIKEVVENGGAVSTAMIKAGYSKRTAVNPNKLTNSKAWTTLMDKYIPDELLAKKHKELLTIPKKVRTYFKGDLTNEYEELDSNAISKGLDMGYKLKGKYAPDKTISVNLDVEASNEELELAQQLREQRKLDTISPSGKRTDSISVG